MSETMKRLIKTALFTPGPKGWGLPLLFWGPPGVAKSDIIEEVGRGWGLHCESLSPGERGDGAFGVTPVPQKTKSGRMVLSYPMPDYVDLFDEDEGRGVIFVDEMTTAPRAVQPALLGLFQARRLGGGKLPTGVRVLAAANPLGSAASGHDLSKANANRCGHIDWDAPDATEWTQYLITQDAKAMGQTVHKIGDAAKEETRVLNLWDNEHAKAKGLIAGFIKRRPDLLHCEPKDEDPQASRQWASRRTWDLTTRAIAGAAIHGLSEPEEMELIASFVGAGPSVELFTYRNYADLPDPLDVLDGKVAWEPDEMRVDRTMAVMSACAAVILSPSSAKGKEHAERVVMMWKQLSKLTKDMRDIALVSGEPLILRDIGADTKEGRQVCAKLAPIVQLARSVR